MPTVEQDWDYFLEGIAVLETYLLSEDVYWPLPGPTSAMPRLTIGGLLLAEIRLRSQMDGPDFLRVDQKMEHIRSKWQSAWERKAGREVKTRLDLWRNYLVEFQDSPERYVDVYPQEVRWRVMLHLLNKEVVFKPAESDALAALDVVLKSFFVPGNFLWKPELTSSFPMNEYWYLYGRIKHDRT